MPYSFGRPDCLTEQHPVFLADFGLIGHIPFSVLITHRLVVIPDGTSRRFRIQRLLFSSLLDFGRHRNGEIDMPGILPGTF